MDEQYVQYLIQVMQNKIAELTSRNLQLEAKVLQNENEKNESESKDK